MMSSLKTATTKGSLYQSVWLWSYQGQWDILLGKDWKKASWCVFDLCMCPVVSLVCLPYVMCCPVHNFLVIHLEIIELSKQSDMVQPGLQIL